MSGIGFNGPPPTVGLATSNIASLDELLSSHAALEAHERADAALLQELVTLNRDKLRTNLFSWASKGFPNIFVILSISLEVPPSCSDGVSRKCYEYIEWLTKSTIPALVNAIQTRLTDIEVSYSIVASTIRIHVTRAK